MFKIFNVKTGIEVNGNYAITKEGYLINYYGNGEYWTFVESENVIAVAEADLKKHNLAFTIIEPADFEYIAVYKVNNLYIAHEYNTHHDEEGVWYLVTEDLSSFKRKMRNCYTFIQYNDNYMEEL